jgi:hypothetical protein
MPGTSEVVSKKRKRASRKLEPQPLPICTTLLNRDWTAFLAALTSTAPSDLTLRYTPPITSTARTRLLALTLASTHFDLQSTVSRARAAIENFTDEQFQSWFATLTKNWPQEAQMMLLVLMNI